MAYGIQIIGKDSAGNNYTVLDSTNVSTRSLGPAPNGGGLFTTSSAVSYTHLTLPTNREV